jgi:16S rRNA (guanine(527)-N(7))-methyltransferase RsmG
MRLPLRACAASLKARSRTGAWWCFRLTELSPPGEGARRAFGLKIEAAVQYAELLATDGVTRGIIGPAETGRLWDRHLVNCAVVADLMPESGTLVDIGSGAGLPGVVLAMLCPGLEVVLLEPMLRRVVFLNECVQSLELPNVQVLRGRAEDMSGNLQADVATARAVAPLDRLLSWSSGVLRPGGTLLAIKGSNAEAELADAKPVLRRLGARSAEVLRVGHDRVDPATTVVRVVTGTRRREEPLGARGSRPGMA